MKTALLDHPVFLEIKPIELVYFDASTISHDSWMKRTSIHGCLEEEVVLAGCLPPETSTYY
jgi:hypothetical protein